MKNRLCRFFQELVDNDEIEQLEAMALWSEGMKFLAFSKRDYASLSWGPIENPSQPVLDLGEDFGIIQSPKQKARFKADHPEFNNK